jgi:hypothetical protein
MQFLQFLLPQHVSGTNMPIIGSKISEYQILESEELFCLSGISKVDVHVTVHRRHSEGKDVCVYIYIYVLSPTQKYLIIQIIGNKLRPLNHHQTITHKVNM